MVNLASEGNAAKINQRFKELEREIRAAREEQKAASDAFAALHGRVDGQARLIDALWKRLNGGGD